MNIGDLFYFCSAHGVAAGGEIGARKAVEILAKELDVTMALSRVSDINCLDMKSLARIPNEFLQLQSFQE